MVLLIVVVEGFVGFLVGCSMGSYSVRLIRLL